MLFLFLFLNTLYDPNVFIFDEMNGTKKALDIMGENSASITGLETTSIKLVEVIVDKIFAVGSDNLA